MLAVGLSDTDDERFQALRRLAYQSPSPYWTGTDEYALVVVAERQLVGHTHATVQLLHPRPARRARRAFWSARRCAAQPVRVCRPQSAGGDAAGERFAMSVWGWGNVAIRDARWRYIRYVGGGEELYDHADDPMEHTNLLALPRSMPNEWRILMPS